MVFAQPANPKAQLQEAQRLHKAGKLAEAAQKYQMALMAAPNDPAILYGFAALEGARGKHDRAIEMLERAAQSAPGEAAIHKGLARLYDIKDRPADALASLEAAQTLEPQNGTLVLERGVALAKLKRFAEAAELFKVVSKAAPNEPSIWHNLGNALIHNKDFGGAVDAFAKAHALRPEDPLSGYALGRAHLYAGEYETALTHLTPAVEAAPEQLQIISYKILALRHLGRHEAADELEGLNDMILTVELDTPAGFDSLAAFNDALESEIVNHAALTTDFKNKSTRNGANLDGLFAENKSPLFEAFEGAVRTSFEKTLKRMPRLQGHPLPLSVDDKGYRLDMWANVLRQGGHQNPHNHATGWFSACYYNVLPEAVETSGDDNQGWIEFGGAAYDLPAPKETPRRRIKPEVGKMVVFPSYVFHRTIPFDSDEVRISTAFDAKPETWLRRRTDAIR